MKRLALSLSLILLSVTPSFAAFTNNVTILEKSDIGKLSDAKLIDAYQDVLVEIEATRTFHLTAGFSTKQYDEYRALLKYRLQLLMEIHSRNIEIPMQMER